VAASNLDEFLMHTARSTRTGRTGVVTKIVINCSNSDCPCSAFELLTAWGAEVLSPAEIEFLGDYPEWVRQVLFGKPGGTAPTGTIQAPKP
jgi:hypothetical protein